MDKQPQLKKLEEIQVAQSTVKSLTLLVWIIAISIALLAFIFSEALFIPIALFFIFFAFSLKETSKHLQNLNKGMTSNQKTDGVITINIQHFSDSINYYAQVLDNNKDHIWKFEFMPLNWEPTKGTMNAKLVWIDDVNWPVLVETEEGIIYPKHNPKKIHK
jgi:hypothetical protein